MHRRYFPLCPVDGPILPAVPYGHLGSRGAVPAKCASCRHLFEGECTRGAEDARGYLHVDHGPCGIDGPTDPVPGGEGDLDVPRKCAACWFLAHDAIHGFHCTKDAAIWGDFPRGLDWGAWRPDAVYLLLPLPKITTRRLSECARAGDLVGFVKEHRRVNPGLSLHEARTDYERFQEILRR